MALLCFKCDQEFSDRSEWLAHLELHRQREGLPVWNSQRGHFLLQGEERCVYELMQRSFPPALTVAVGRGLLPLADPHAGEHLGLRLPRVREALWTLRGVRLGSVQVKDDLTMPNRGWWCETPDGRFAEGTLPETPGLDRSLQLKALLKLLQWTCLRHCAVFWNQRACERAVMDLEREQSDLTFEVRSRLNLAEVTEVLRQLLVEGGSLTSLSQLLRAMLADHSEGTPLGLTARLLAAA